MIRRSNAVVLLGLATFLAGCSASHEVPRDPGDAAPRDAGVEAGATLEDASSSGITFEEFVDEYFALQCARSMRCESQWEPTWECHPYFVDSPRGKGHYLDAMIRGAAILVESQALACLNEMRSETTCRGEPSCAGLWAPDQYAPIIVGTRAIGESCFGRLDCTLDGDCAGLTCPGTCLRRASLGESCLSVDCAVGLACTRSGCVPARREGESCDAELRDCAFGLRCGDGVCVDSASAGAGDPCGAYYCDDGLACVATAEADTCVPADGTMGEPCDTSTPCGPWLRCIGGTCKRISAPGEPCEPGSCVGTYFCHEGMCRPLPIMGESCAASGLCLFGECIDGTCTLLPPGSACGSDRWPTIERCDGSCDADGTCRATPSFPSSWCALDTQCGEGFTCRPWSGTFLTCQPECPGP